MMKNPSGVQTSSFIIKIYKLISSLMQLKTKNGVYSRPLLSNFIVHTGWLSLWNILFPDP